MSILKEDYWAKLVEKKEQLQEKISTDPWRLAYHIMPETGWMNDPNGLCQFNGVYHFYHQYEPASATNANPIHWGHKTSMDLVHFQEEAIFLSPEHEYDRDGVYSGSSISKDGVLHLFYTGNVKKEGDHDYTYSGREQNTVHVISKDGFTIESQEVVIPHSAYPEGFTDHIRDPKVFEQDNKYFMILGSRTRNNEGKVLLYQSADLSQWEYKGVFFGDEFSLGFMWECPDYFNKDSQDVLVLSPQGMNGDGFKFENIYQSGYLLGDVNWSTLKFKETSAFIEFDRGFDFYAPQTFEDEKGRRILFGWMGMGDTTPAYSYPTVTRGWQHNATLPRELFIEDGKLFQRPLPEYQGLRKEKETYSFASSRTTAHNLKGDVYEMLVNPLDQNGFCIFLREDTELVFENGIFSLNHGPSGYGRKRRSIQIEQISQLQVFMDTSSIEIFINDGEYVLSTRVFPKENQTNIDFSGPSRLEITKWDLTPTNIR